MPNSTVIFTGMPDSDPATIPAAFTPMLGDPAGMAILNGTFRGKGGGRSGIRNTIPFNIVDDLVTVEATISRLSSDYAPGIGFTFDGLVNYHLYVGMYNFGIRRAVSLNGASVVLGNVARTSINNVPYTLTYKPSTGRLQAFADGVLILTVTDTTYTGPDIYGVLYSSGYNSWNETSSFTAYNVNVYTVTSVNGGLPVYPGQTGIQAVTTGYTQLPSSILCTYSNGTKSIPVTDIAGTINNPTFSLGNRVDGSDCPLVGTILTFTFINGVESSSFTLPYTNPVNEVIVEFANPNTDDPAFLTYYIASAGLVADGGTFFYIPPSTMPGLVIGTDGSIDSTAEGIIEGWFIPLTGPSMGTAQAITLIVNDTGVVRYGVSNGINTNGFPTATGITIGGVSAIPFSGSNDVYRYTLPALTNGVISPKIGLNALIITDGTNSASYDVNVQPPTTQFFVSLSSGGNGTRYVGNYVTCVPGDQIVYDLPTELGVSLNRVTATGEIQTDFNGIQHFWHINGVTGLVTELIITTVTSTFATIDLSTCLMQMESPLFDGAYFNIDRP
jgi:hypothetical protein